jgi:hypothetical protein
MACAGLSGGLIRTGWRTTTFLISMEKTLDFIGDQSQMLALNPRFNLSVY